MQYTGCENGRLPGPLGICLDGEFSNARPLTAFDDPSDEPPVDPSPVVLVEPEPASGWTADLQMRDFSSTPLSDNRPTATDVRQGRTGNCPVIATLAALAHARPGKVAGMISRQETEVLSKVWDTNEVNPTLAERPVKSRHLYQVTFATDSPLPVSGLLWHRADALEYGRSVSGDLWPSILEKAFVVNHGGHSYQRIFDTVTPWEAMTTMLGPARELTLAEKGADPKSMLQHARTKPTIAATLDDLPAEVTVPDGIIANHAYAVLGLTGSGVEVYNALDGAKIVVPLATFRRVFDTVVQSH